MHFRFRGNSVQVVRSTREPGSGRAKSVPIGSIHKETLRISDRLRAACTPEELREIEEWVLHYGGTEHLKREFAAFSLAEQMELAATWFESAGPDADPLLNDAIVQGWQRLRRLLASKS